MNKKAVFIAPHADDESLGCGGTILKYIDKGWEVHWLLVSNMSEEAGYSEDQVRNRKEVINKGFQEYNFYKFHEFNLMPGKLDEVPMSHLVGLLSEYFDQIQPSHVFTCFGGDAHTDHKVVFNAVISATKSFRKNFIKKVFAYETISETDYGNDITSISFQPNIYIDISKYFKRKVEIIKFYDAEIGEFPFPRSIKAIEALSNIRGSQSCCNHAESFMLIKELLD